MALSPEQSDALIREVDDAVRQDDMMSFWTRYGRLVFIAIIAGLAAFGGWLIWQNYQNGVAEGHSEQYATLLKSAQGGQIDEALQAKLKSEGGAGYGTETALVTASLATGKGDVKAALADFDAIIADPKTPKVMKDLAQVRRTALAFDTAPPADVIAALKPLAVPGNAWFGSAGELSAIAYLKMNKKREAGEMFASMSRDPQVPDSIRLRAGQMASMLGVPPQAIGSVREQETIVAQ